VSLQEQVGVSYKRHGRNSRSELGERGGGGHADVGGAVVGRGVDLDQVCNTAKRR